VRASAAAALAVLALAASGCGSGVGKAITGNADEAHGKQLFISTCAVCHTLGEAKASGKVGPNLDEAFRPSLKQGFKESTIRQVVADQIKFPGNYGDSGPTMPKNLVKGTDVDDVAAYVAAVAGPHKGVSISAPPPRNRPSRTSSASPGRRAATRNASTGWTIVARNAPNGSPPTSR
jgi:mono/diheme cytochrome c family protein